MKWILIALLSSLSLAASALPLGFGDLAMRTSIGPTNSSSLAWDGQWFFDSNANDSSGNGHSLTYTGSPSYGTGPNGNPDLVLNGTSQYAALSSASVGNYTSQNFSISIWVKVTTVTPLPIFIGNGGYQLYGYYLYASSATVVSMIFNQNGAQQTINSDGTTFALSGWHHVCMVRSGTSCKIYIDGVDHTASGQPSVVNPVTSTDAVHIGIYPDTPPGFYLQGEVDDARITAVALTSSQVTTIYTAGAQ